MVLWSQVFSSTLSIAGLPRSVRFRRWNKLQYRLVMSCNVGYCIDERSEVIFRPMVNSGSIPEGEQDNLETMYCEVKISCVNISLEKLRDVLSS